MAEGYESLVLRLRAIERELAALSARHGPLGHLAKALYPEIPTDILNHIYLGVPRERVRDVLGSAHKVVSNVWWYRCHEAMIQVEFYKDSGAQSVALALTLGSPASGFVVPGFGKALGSMRLADVLSDDAPLRFRSSLRTEELLVETRVGPTGAWKNFTFGVLRPLAPGSLMDVEFDWDYETQALRSKPSEVLINWVGISESIEEVWFDWSVAVP